jgi:hypothetical protein
MSSNLNGIFQHRGIKIQFLLCGLVILVPIILSGCKKDQRIAFIQGEWYYKDTHLANIVGESAQESSWTFDNGYFSLGSCCFVKSYFSGYYVVTGRSENKLNLELYHLEGQNGDIVLHRDDTLYAEIIIDTDADAITINSHGPYSRVKP